MKKAFILDMKEINSILLSYMDICIEVDMDGWFYAIPEGCADFDESEFFDILGKKFKAEVEGIIVDTTFEKVAVFCK